MLTIHELLAEVDRLPAGDKWQLVKHLLDGLEHEQAAPSTPTDYHQFLRETYGALSDTPIERGDPANMKNVSRWNEVSAGYKYLHSLPE